MSSNRILLDYDTCNEEKMMIANSIIDTYNLPLSVEQILLACKKIQSSAYFYGKAFEFNIVVLLDKILNINIGMYIAIIIACCGEFYAGNLGNFMIQRDKSNDCIDVGLNSNGNFMAYCILLNYCDFDISNIPNIPDNSRKKIERYHFNKYGGKLTKSAIKK